MWFLPDTVLKQTVQTPPLFSSDHLGMVLKICGPHFKASRWDGDDHGDKDDADEWVPCIRRM
jgi:hypothetical protein